MTSTIWIVQCGRSIVIHPLDIGDVPAATEDGDVACGGRRSLKAEPVTGQPKVADVVPEHPDADSTATERRSRAPGRMREDVQWHPRYLARMAVAGMAGGPVMRVARRLVGDAAMPGELPVPRTMLAVAPF